MIQRFICIGATALLCVGLYIIKESDEKEIILFGSACTFIGLVADICAIS